MTRVAFENVNVMMNFSKLCRACLSNGNQLENLFDHCTPSIFYYCTSVEVSEIDNFPKKLCPPCIDLLHKVYTFKQLVIKSNSILNKYATNQLKFELGITDEISNGDSELADAEINEIYIDEGEILQSNEIIKDSFKCNEIFQNKKILSSKEMKIGLLNNEVQIDNELHNHNINIVNSNIKQNCMSDEGTKKKVKRKFKDRLKCIKCDKTFQKYENLEAHIRKHFGLEPDIKCTDCHKRFKSTRNLHSHMRVHSRYKKYQCLICGKKFAYLNVLKNHEWTHAGIKKYFCHLCDSKFVQACNLKTHLMMHKSEKLYGCNECGKKFIQRGNLKTHLIRHTGIKNVACHLCDMKFYVKGDMERHMKSHSTDRPFPCRSCEKTFKTRSHLGIHMRNHTGERPYGCDFCPMKFKTRKDFKNHRMTHTGEKPHKCHLCSLAFIQKSALNRHLKSHFKQERFEK